MRARGGASAAVGASRAMAGLASAGHPIGLDHQQQLAQGRHQQQGHQQRLGWTLAVVSRLLWRGCPEPFGCGPARNPLPETCPGCPKHRPDC
jgi:hypothetical protein